MKSLGNQVGLLPPMFVVYLCNSFKICFTIFIYLCMCLQVPGEAKAVGFPELESQVVESPAWMLGTELGSSATVLCALEHTAIFSSSC